MNWKSFFKPKLSKIVSTIILLIAYLAVGFICSPAYTNSGIIFGCGKILDYFFIPVSWAFYYPYFILFYLILFYMLVCLVTYIFNKIQNKR
jgi:TRAP-type C4-dicarboxylate transport system permease small subunit